MTVTSLQVKLWVSYRDETETQSVRDLEGRMCGQVEMLTLWIYCLLLLLLTCFKLHSKSNHCTFYINENSYIHMNIYLIYCFTSSGKSMDFFSFWCEIVNKHGEKKKKCRTELTSISRYHVTCHFCLLSGTWYLSRKKLNRLLWIAILLVVMKCCWLFLHAAYPVVMTPQVHPLQSSWLYTN